MRKQGRELRQICNHMFYCDFLASRKGFEPLTYGLGNRCSILLSYRDAVGRICEPARDLSNIETTDKKPASVRRRHNAGGSK